MFFASAVVLPAVAPRTPGRDGDRTGGNSPWGQPVSVNLSKRKCGEETANPAFQEMPRGRKGKGEGEIGAGAVAGLRRNCSRDRKPLMFEREREDFREGERRSPGWRQGLVSLHSVMPRLGLGSGYLGRCVGGAGRGT